MASYFLDTSALVKRHIVETGHTWVQSICSPAAGNILAIAETSLVEVVATFSRMARENPPRLTAVERDQVISDFNARFLRQYVVVEIDRAMLDRAAKLSMTQPLRAYDAVQLACALTRRDDNLAAGEPAPIFVCADVNLLAVATTEGLAIENPNDHP